MKSISKKESIKLKNNIAKIKAMGKDAIIPAIGMGASYGAGSDSYPATIIEVSPTLDYIIIQDDKSTPTKDYEYYENQSYTYAEDKEGSKTKYTLRKDGRYIKDGCPLKAYWQSVTIGVRRYYRDPSF